MLEIGNTKIKINFEWQEGKLGRAFKLSKIEKGKKEKWIDRQLKNDWIYTFIYKDGGFFSLHIGINGEFISKTNNKN